MESGYLRVTMHWSLWIRQIPLQCRHVQIRHRFLWQTPPGAVHSSVVQTRPDAAQAPVVQTPPGAVHSSVVQTRPDAAQAPVVQTPPGIAQASIVQMTRLLKRSKSFENDVFFDIEAKRTRSIVVKFISKQSKHVYTK